MKLLALAAAALLAACVHQPPETQPGPEPVPPQQEMGGAETTVQHHHAMGTRGMRSLQRALADKGYYHGRVDGVDGPRTKHAVARYQQDLGVDPTGEADEQTWSSLGLSE